MRKLGMRASPELDEGPSVLTPSCGPLLRKAQHEARESKGEGEARLNEFRWRVTGIGADIKKSPSRGTAIEANADLRARSIQI